MANVKDQDRLLEIAKDFFVSDEDINVVSSLGFLHTVLSDVLDRQGAKAIIDNRERHVITADSWDGLLKHARARALDVDLAKAAILPIKLYIYLEDIEMYSSSVDITSDKEILKIEDPKFKIGDYVFKLDYPIHIITRIINGVRKYTTQYDTSIPNIISDIKNNNIVNKTMYYNGKKCLMLQINIREYTIQESVQSFIDQTNSSDFTVAFKNKLSDLQVLYKDPGSETYRSINTAMFIEGMQTGETIFYTIKDSSVIFTNKYASGSFYPEPGGQFLFRLYTTTAVMFEEFSGTKSITTDADTFFDLSFDITGPTVGGKDRMTKEQMRERIIGFSSNYDNLIKESDLKLFYKQNGNSNSKYDVKKYVDDYNDRIYNVCLQLNNNNIIIPTNTVDMKITAAYSFKRPEQETPVGIGLEKFDEKHMYLVYDDYQKFINVRKRIVDPNDKNAIDSVVVAYEEYLADKALGNNSVYLPVIDEICYTLPFQICYNRKYQLITAFDKVVNAEHYTNYTYISADNDSTVGVNSVEFKKEISFSDNKYSISFNLTPNNRDMIDLIHQTVRSDINSNSVTQDTGYLKCVVFFQYNGDIIGYIPMNMLYFDTDDETYTFSGDIKILSPIYHHYLDTVMYDPTTNLIDTGIYDPVTETLDCTTINISETKIRIGVFCKNPGYNPTITEQYLGIINFPDYQIMNVFDFDDSVRLFDEMTHLLSSQIKKVETNSSAETDNEVVLSTIVDKMPFIRYDYFLANQNSVIKEIKEELKLMDTLQYKIEQQFKMRLNFVNTYGYSTRLRIGLEKLPLGTTHLKLNFKVKINKSGSMSIDTLKEFINSYFMNLDFENGVSFHISRLIDEAMDNFADSLVFIEFHGANGFDPLKQYITMVEDSANAFIPEVPNIMRDADNKLMIEITEV